MKYGKQNSSAVLCDILHTNIINIFSKYLIFLSISLSFSEHYKYFIKFCVISFNRNLGLPIPKFRGKKMEHLYAPKSNLQKFVSRWF